MTRTNYCSMRPVLYNSDMIGVTSGEGTGNPWEKLSSPPVLVGFVLMDLSLGAAEFTHGFSGVRVDGFVLGSS